LRSLITISPLQQIGLGSTCFEDPLMKGDSVKWINNSPFNLGSSNWRAQLTPPQSPIMMKIVCNEAKSPLKQNLEIKEKLEFK